MASTDWNRIKNTYQVELRIISLFRNAYLLPLYHYISINTLS